MYAVYIKDWLSVFPPDQLFVTTLEEYSQNRLATLNEIFVFLGLGECKFSVHVKGDVDINGKWKAKCAWSRTS